MKAYKKTSVGMCSRQRYITMKEEGYRKYGCRGIKIGRVCVSGTEIEKEKMKGAQLNVAGYIF